MISPDEIAQIVGTIIVYGFLFIFFAGMYATFYPLGKLFQKPWLMWIGYAFAVAQFVSAMIMVSTGYLDAFWVTLVVFTALAYLVIPPAMWRLVLAFHRQEKEQESSISHAHSGLY